MANSNTKTKGVVLSSVLYNDRSQFVRIYTEQLGKVTCKVALTRLRHSGGQRMLYAPLSVLDMVIDSHPNHDICKISEANLILSPYTLSMYDPGKTAQCMYMAELLDRTVKEIEPNPRLWSFIFHSVELLQLTEEGSANFHLLFTTRLCYHIGFHVENSTWKEGIQFDIQEGTYTHSPIHHPYYLTAESASWLHKLLDTNFTNLSSLHLTREQRNILLDMMLTFLRIHMPEIGILRSVDVLKELFI